VSARRAALRSALAGPSGVSRQSVTPRAAHAEGVALAQKATGAHPGDARAWLLLAGTLPPGANDRREAALRKAVEVDPSSGLALNGLAWHLLGLGRADEALPLARRAVEVSPGSAPSLDTLAGVAEARGDCSIALQIQRRALDLLPEGLSEQGRAPYRERLQRLDKACGSPQPAPQPVPPAAPAAATE